MQVAAQFVVVLGNHDAQPLLAAFGLHSTSAGRQGAGVRRRVRQFVVARKGVALQAALAPQDGFVIDQCA